MHHLNNRAFTYRYVPALSHFLSKCYLCLQQNFNTAAAKVKSLTKRPTDQELLELYALFKQGSVGDNNTSNK